MSWLIEIAASQFLLFALVLVRTSGLMIVAQIYGSRDVPMQVRALLAFALALLIAPSQLGTPFAPPTTMLGFLVLIGCELLIGLTLGLGVSILFGGVQLAGQVIAQASGMALADVFNPTFESQVPLFSHLLHMFTLAVYAAIGGHRMLMAGLLDTFASIPPGSACAPVSMIDTITVLVGESFSLGLRAAAPTTVALLLATLVMGLVSRTLPQLNILAFGFGLNALATFLALSFSLAGIAWLFEGQLEPTVALLLEALLPEANVHT